MIMDNKVRFIAFYLPQYHPIPENDEWWGKGFTEWVNVAKARPLYHGHYQPKIPADLGFYDLRMPEIREAQALLAREAGIEGFCYWHYWFGNGKQLLERPFNEVLESGKPDFPFCLAWANASWANKKWDKSGDDKVLIKQTYPGEEDYINHFNALLPAFKDKRYIRVDGKILFLLQKPEDNPDMPRFIEVWRKLAQENGLKDFYFVGEDADSRNLKKYLSMGFDAIYNRSNDSIHHHLPLFKKVLLWMCREWLHLPTVFKYKDAIKYMVSEDCKKEEVIPVILPNWDHSPRSGGRAMIYQDCNPKFFKRVAKRAIAMVLQKPIEKRLIIVKSWNEWGEGNYMEPDIKYGKGYIKALSKAIEEIN